MTTAGPDKPSEGQDPSGPVAKAPVAPAARAARRWPFRTKKLEASVDLVPLPPDENRKAIYAWAAEEIKQGTSRMYDVGKFLLTIATGTGGAFVTFYTGRSLYLGKLFLACIILHLVAMGAGIWTAWPRQWRAGAATDLYRAYGRDQFSARAGLWIWLVTWFAAIVVAGAALYVHPPRADGGASNTCK